MTVHCVDKTVRMLQSKVVSQFETIPNNIRSWRERGLNNASQRQSQQRERTEHNGVFPFHGNFHRKYSIEKKILVCIAQFLNNRKNYHKHTA